MKFTTSITAGVLLPVRNELVKKIPLLKEVLNDGVELPVEILQKCMYDVSKVVVNTVSRLLIERMDGCEEEQMNLSRIKSILQ
jgi:hypothetical protein